MADLHTELDRALRRTQGAPMFPPFAIPTQRDPLADPCLCAPLDPASLTAEPTPIEGEALRALKVTTLRTLAGALGVDPGGNKGEIAERVGRRP